jgi:hypothetical protein
MKGASLKVMVVAALAGLAFPAPLAAQEETETPAGSAPAGEARTEAAVPKSGATPRPGSRPETPLPDKPPQDAAAALVRASAAYEYGDMNQVVESARPVAEGLLPATPEEQIQAFRLLGIGLYLTNRPLGAETAFTELLRKDPHARLDPTSTRPELVAFFESLRHQQIARQRSTRKVYWNFLPPAGQFQNDDHVKGWLVLGVGVVAAATWATSLALYESWKLPHEMSKHPDAAPTLKTVNVIGGGILIATYIYGVFDGLIGYGKPLDESKPPVSLLFLPGGGGLGFTF